MLSMGGVHSGATFLGEKCIGGSIHSITYLHTKTTRMSGTIQLKDAMTNEERFRTLNFFL